MTEGLPGAGAPGGAPSWGRWFRQVDARVHRGVTVMTGDRGDPLLVLDRVGKGRVAQLLSDEMWLWARGFEGGGPQAELLRRLAYWLMKEPDLEENDLRAAVDGDRLAVTRQSLAAGRPPGHGDRARRDEPEPRSWPPDAGGRSSGSLAIAQMGLYRVSDGSHTALAAAGPLNPIEFADVRTTAEKLGAGRRGYRRRGLLGRLRAGSRKFAGSSPDRTAAGRDWMGFRANGDYIVTGFSEMPLLPAVAALLLIVGGLLAAWRREGR